MSDAKEVKFSLKVLMNKEKTKVFFAEAESDFTDVLLSFLALPLGKIVKVLEKYHGDKAPVIGSLTTLYNGLANPNIAHFWTERGKNVLLNPRSIFEYDYSNLKVNLDYTLPMNCEIGKPYDGVFTTNTASFIIFDDLRVMPNVTGSILETLRNLGFTSTDMEEAEIRTVTFGFNEIMDLLKGSLFSRTPLADLILNKKQMDFGRVKSEPGNLLHQIEREALSGSKKMILKVMLQKSTKKFVFAQAWDDFVDFLFSMLIIPLGRVEWLLDSNTCFKSIDNLHRSIANHIHNQPYMKTQYVKEDQLIRPNLPDIYTPEYLFANSEGWLHPSLLIGERFFVKGVGMYMVTDDLTVTPLSITSSLNVLKGMKISLSDVEELELHIGLEEGLSILKASLTSTAALTDGLINPILNKQPKQNTESI